MKFSKSYEPTEFEPTVYGLWEQSDAFSPKINKINNASTTSKTDTTNTSKADNTDTTSNASTTDATSPQTPYSIVMPPPNANGNLHIGHGLTVALEDILTRYHRLSGQNTIYIPGADHAGFETWVVYEHLLTEKGQSRFDFTREELYNGVWDFVAEKRGGMELQLRALGASCDWQHLMFTLDQPVVDTVYDTFEKLFQDGLVYRGKKLVNFCTHHHTAFADIEVQYKEQEGTLYNIAYPLTGGGEIIVSTVRPETIFGDTAIAVDPDDTRYSHLIGQKAHLPLTDRTIPIIADEYVDQSFGTGAVKITPAHDPNDYEISERHHLDIISVIEFDGTMSDNTGKYAGLTILEAREKVLADLEAAGLRRGEKPHTRNVGHCYKCGTIIEPLLKEQWFIKTAPLAERAIQSLENNEIKFYPASKKKVLINYYKNLKDWNISRQIPWGIPIPAFKSEDGEWIISREVHQKQLEQGGKIFTRDEDTFDTWFSSGQWPFITTKKNNLPDFYPISVMETGSDLLFPWISRMIMLGLYVTDQVPFKEVYMHGMVLDEKGQKMSKSKGNVINPMEVIAEYGSDAFRLGIIANRSAALSQAFSPSSVIAGRNLCNKLWNIARFAQDLVDKSANNNSSEHKDLARAASATQSEAERGARSVSEELVISDLSLAEAWITHEIHKTKQSLAQLIRSYRFAECQELIYDLIWNKYADWFIESAKTSDNTTVLKTTLEEILILSHPFMPFITETIWQTLSWTDGLLINQESRPDLTSDAQKAAEFETIRVIVSETRKTASSLKLGNKGILLHTGDPIITENASLIKSLAKLKDIKVSSPRGLRLPIENHEIFLDIDEKTLNKHRSNLESRILALSKEIDTLNLRLNNPNYTEKAPKALVDETKSTLESKKSLADKLTAELNLV